MKAPANFSRKAAALAVAAACLLLVHVERLESQEALLLRPDRVLDGTGVVFEGASVLVRSDRIERVIAPGRGGVSSDAPPGDAVVVDLRGATLLPGLIDTHVHLDWYFDDHDRLRTEASGDGVEEQVLHALENAWRMLQAGVTTVQSLGSPLDRAVRDALARGVLPGPRVLTSLDAITAETGDAEAIRARVRALHQDGADVIKVFGSASIRDGGGPTLSQEQLDAACGEAKKLALRATVHAHGPESARRAAHAGCTTIEHGALLDRATLELLGSRGLFYDPNIDLIFRNYFENEQRYLGIGNYTAEGFAQMRLAQPRRSRRSVRRSRCQGCRSCSAPTPWPARTAATSRSWSTASSRAARIRSARSSPLPPSRRAHSVSQTASPTSWRSTATRSWTRALC